MSMAQVDMDCDGKLDEKISKTNSKEKDEEDTISRADLEVHFKEGETIKCLVDVTVSSIHKEANKKAGKITSGVAMVGEQRKDKDYARYLHDGDVIGFAADSAGGLSDSAVKFINRVYCKPKSVEFSIWHSDKDRVTCKKRFVDGLSCILAKHRAMDKINLNPFPLSPSLG